jgi:hypothetical protein
MAAAIVFALIYGVITVVHTCQAIRYRAWYCVPIIIGAFWEVGGYAARAAASHFPDSVTVYAAQSILIVLAPACKSSLRTRLLVCYHPTLRGFYAFKANVFRALP